MGLEYPLMPGYREKALRFYGRKCERCGDASGVEVHHIDENRKNDSIGNLMVLCHGCHGEAHSGEFVPKREHQHDVNVSLTHEQQQIAEALFKSFRDEWVGKFIQEAVGRYLDEVATTAEVSLLDLELLSERRPVRVRDSDDRDIILLLED